MPLNAIKNYVKEELPGIYEAGKFLRDRAEDFNENREQVFEGVQQQLNGKDSTQINEEVRPIGSEAVLNGQPVFWSGQNYGWQSKGSFDKLMDEGQFRMGGIAAQRIGNSITEAIPQEVKDFATEKITDAANAAVDFYQDQDYETQQRINVGLNIANGVVTLADQGLEFISEKTNTSRFITDELAMAALTGGGSAALRRATPAIEQGAKTAIKAIDKYGPTIDNIFPPTPPAALATAGSAPQVQLNVSGGKANLNLAPQVLKAASTLPTPTNWQNRARVLYGKQEHKALADFFRRGQGGKLSTKNTFITADELALNKDGVLDQVLERADRMENLRKKWSEQGKEIKGDRQRELYDAGSLNFFVPDIEMYTSDEARKFITKFTNVLSKDQWHHVFGNKEAGEFILSIANSDPLVAANLFKKMEILGLNSSGVAQNIAILKEAKHTNWHNFIKDMGMEPKSPGKPLSVKGSTAPGDFADLSQEMGRAIAAGKGNINDAFELIELYAKYNNWMKKQITSERFGGRIISDLPEGVGKAVQIGGYRKRPAKSKYKPLPPM